MIRFTISDNGTGIDENEKINFSRIAFIFIVCIFAIAALVFAVNTGRPSANVVFQGIYAAYPNLSFANNFDGYLENHLYFKTLLYF